MIRFSGCCINCTPPKRSIGCHGRCAEYLESKQEHERVVEEYKRSKSGQLDAHLMFRDFVDRTKKKKNTRGEWKGGESR